MSTPITGALVVCVAAAGVAAGALFLEAGDDNPATSQTTTGAVAAPSSNAGSGGYGAPDPGAGSAAGATLQISGFQFDSVEAAAGSRVTVDNRDSAPHTVTAEGGAFDTGEVSGGTAATFTAPSQPGSYEFQCEIHPDMSGTLTVR